MRTNVNYFMLRTIFALLLGVVLILRHKDAIHYLIIASGILFIIPGLVSLIRYLLRDRDSDHAEFSEKTFPIEGVGSLFFGVVLVIVPHFFVKFLMYLLGAILLLGSIGQIVTLIKVRKQIPVSTIFYMAPMLIALAGLLILYNPFKVAETVFILIGATSLIYGIVEFVYWMKFCRKYDPESLPTN